VLVILYSRTPCRLCGYLFRLLMQAPVRVNKRTMRTTGPLLGASGSPSCPECGTPNEGDLMPRSPYVLDPESARKVTEYRQRKFGIGAGNVARERAS
jgi:hypothetical protein